MSTHRKQKMYFAAPLFNDMERQFNNTLSKKLEKFFDIYLPQKDGGLMADMISEGIHPSEAARRVFCMDIEAIRECDVLLIILDGRTVDEGATFELGFAYALGKVCYGLQTDVRRLLKTGNNPMIDCGLRHVFKDFEELINWARQFANVKTPILELDAAIAGQQDDRFRQVV
jgi:nucleoside 2-deoxyribosyltransferase